MEPREVNMIAVGAGVVLGVFVVVVALVVLLEADRRRWERGTSATALLRDNAKPYTREAFLADALAGYP